MRPPELRLFGDELIIDSFAGGGGASLGIEMALGRSPDIAINHDSEALAMHKVNHPNSLHLCEDVCAVDPVQATGGRKVGLMWLSPDCKHFSKAKGGKPVEKKIRGLAWIAVRWAKAVRPRVIVLENVEEFQDWGPLQEDGHPCALRKGLTFRRFIKQLENCGYCVEHDELVAANYGAPTTRRRFFLVARCDGQPIAWPEATHGAGRSEPWRAAAKCIEWALPCPSIFERARPLADNTHRRIARGIKRYVLDTPEPFIVPLAESRLRPGFSTNKPGRALVSAFLAKHYGGHETPGTSLAKSIDTITAQDHHALVAAHIQRDFGQSVGSSAAAPVGTITGGGGGKCGLVASSLVKLKGTCRDGQPVTAPLHTIQASGNHYGEVRAFLMKYHANGGQWNRLQDPMPTVVANDSLGLVTVHGERYVITDIA